MDTGDEVACVAAAHHLGLIAANSWPMVAAYLVAAGYDGEDLVALASLPATASGWSVDQLVPGALTDVSAPSLTDDHAAEVVARLIALLMPEGKHPLVRSLAAVAVQRENYDPGVLLDAFLLEDTLDAGWLPGISSRDGANEFEARFRECPPVNLPLPLAQILVEPFARFSADAG